MKNIKRLIAFIGIFIMGISLVPAYYAKADEQVSVSISSAQAELSPIMVDGLPRHLNINA